ncbi:MAG: beta-galactosidase [Bacteroidales bacterium]|nr:beta-galactosidase [Bacteroidales bacterium]
MKKFLLIVAAVIVVAACTEKKQTYDWAPAGDHILTSWGENLDPTNVLPEYPRPQMVREQWMNLNGFWDFRAFDTVGKILVPFPFESALSGVGQRLRRDSVIIYSTKITVPASYLKDHVLLNCGGIDCVAEIKINGEFVRKHVGGFTAISEDVTKYLKKGENEIVIKVTDATDTGYQAVGKQRCEASGIWYTPVSGIWQTIWLEPVSETHISNLRITPYLDLETFTVNAATSTGKGTVEVKIFDGKKQVASGKGEAGKDINIKMKDLKLWTPDDPFLYDFKITVKDGGKTVDRVKSYSAMRKVSVNQDGFGTLRIALNNKPIFCFGPLDQGWWPDGLYTAPTDEALEFDIRRTKELGYNTIRKHVKVEPDRWYYHCDRLGVMVWQDMPSGDYSNGQTWECAADLREGPEPETTRSAESQNQYWRDWYGIVNQLYNHPCIIVWVPFNEAWGQFHTMEIATRTKLMDPTRLVNPASGGNLMPCGDLIDFHNYRENPLPFSYPHKDYVVVMGEFGGLGLRIPEHTWVDDGWGYRQMIGDSETLTDKYVGLVKQIFKNVDQMAISAAIYTQTTDCETELNGIFTYDRKVFKFNEEPFVEINKRLSHSLD